MKTTNLDICGYCRRTLPKKFCKRHSPKTSYTKARYYSEEQVQQLIREQRIETYKSILNYTEPANDYVTGKTIPMIDPHRLLKELEALTDSHKENKN